MPSERSSVAPLRIVSFRRLWIASIVFNLGHLVQVVASSWVMLELTGSPLWVSLMVGAPFLPLLFLSLPAGAAADLLDRRRLIIGSSSVMVAASGGMAALWGSGTITPARLLALGLLFGVGSAFFNPAWQAIMPRLVPVGLLPGAVALNSASGGMATALGPALGGVLVATVGAGWTFAVATVGYTAILVAVLLTRTREWPQDAGSMLVAIATGLRYLRFSAGYRWLLLLGAAFGFSSAAVRGLLPNITSDLLEGDATLYGFLLGAFGAGALVGGLTRTVGSHLLQDRMLPGSVAVYGVGGMALALSSVAPLSLVATFFVGVGWTWVLATLNTTFQILSPDWVRGRAMGAFVLSVFGFMPIGSAVSGALGDLIEASASLLVFSALVLVLGLAALRFPLPVLEHIEPPEVPGDAGAHLEGEIAPAPVMVTTTWVLRDGEDFEGFLNLLAQLRRLRLSTGAYHWAVYRSAHDHRRISEVFMVHSWELHLQQHRRLDTRGLALVREAEGFAGAEEVTTDHLIAFEAEDAQRRPDWEVLRLEHEEMHRGRRAQPR